MAGFLEYGTPKGGPTAPAPFIADTDPRGKTGEEVWGILQYERDRAEEEEDTREAYAKENDFTAMNHIGRAIVQESLVGNLLGKADDFIAEYDKDFDVEPLIDSTWPEWRQNAVRDANNAEHAQRLIDRTQEQQLYQEEGQYLGGIGMATEMAGAILNPEIALLGAGEIALLGKLGLAGGKAVLAGAAIGGLSNAAQEAVIVSNNKSRTKLGIATAGLFGAALGGFGGLFSPASEIIDIDKTLGSGLAENWKVNLDSATGDIKTGAAFTMSPDAQLWNEAVTAGVAAQDPVSGKFVVQIGDNLISVDTQAEAIARAKIAKAQLEAPPKVPGAPKTVIDPTPAQVAEQMSSDYHATVAQLDKQVPRRKNILGKLASMGLEGRASKNPVARWLFSILTEDASGTGGKQIAAHSGVLHAERYKQSLRDFHVSRHTTFKKWAKSEGNNLKRYVPWDDANLSKFDDLVHEELNFRAYPDSRPKGWKTNPAIAEAADAYRKAHTDMFELQRVKGVAGYTADKFDKHYIAREWDGLAMSRISTKLGDADGAFVQGLIKKAILAGREFENKAKYGRLGEKLTDEFKDKTATNMSRAIYQRFTRRIDTVNMARSGWLTRADRATVIERAEAIINNEADLKHLIDALSAKDSRIANELLTQIDMDINVAENGISIRDFMNTNLGASMDTKIRRASGKSAMAEMGFQDRDAFHEWVEKARRWDKENTQMDVTQLEAQGLKYEKLWDLMMGTNLEDSPNKGIANMARAFREMATLVSLNQVGFAQASETGKLVGSLGVKQFIKQIPSFGKMIRDARTGTLKDAFLQDIEAACGFKIGMDEIINHPALLADEGGYGFTKSAQRKFTSGLQTAIYKGLHAQGYINGMNQLMKMQHRMSARGFFMRMCEDVKNIDIRAGRLRRYADIGLSPEDLKAVSAELDRNATYGKGWFGQDRVLDMGLQNFEPVLREKLIRSMLKRQHQTIQKTLGGEESWWMTTTMGKMMSQFRTFPLVAIEKQTMKDLKFCDIEAFTTLTATMGMASAAYVAKTYANSFGLDSKKRKQYLKNRLSPEKIAAGAASWAPQLNILPDVMASLGNLGLVNPFMYTYQKGQEYRDYNLDNGLSLSDIGPAGAYVEKGYKTVTGLGRVALTSDELSAQNFKYITGLIPFGNALPIKGAANYLLR